MTNSTKSPSGTVQPSQKRLADGGEAVSLSTTIVRKVAAEKDVAPSALPPLYEVIDPDALDALYAHGASTVQFEYAGHLITITPDERILLDQ